MSGVKSKGPSGQNLVEKTDSEEEKKEETKEKETEEKAPNSARLMYQHAAKGELEQMKTLYVQDKACVKQRIDEEPQEPETLEGNNEAIFLDTPLHAAAEQGQEEAADLLINWEVELDAPNRIKSTALHRAVSNNQPALVEKLLKNGSSVNAQNKIGNYPLHCAAFGGFLEVAQILCKYGATKQIREENLAGMTPLNYCKNKALTEFLLSQVGASPGHLKKLRTRETKTEASTPKEPTVIHLGPRVPTTLTTSSRPAERTFSTEAPSEVEFSTLEKLDGRNNFPGERMETDAEAQAS